VPFSICEYDPKLCKKSRLVVFGPWYPDCGWSPQGAIVCRQERGFTLLELLIVVMIIGIIAAIAVPNLMTAIERSRQKRTMADMRSIATAWEARNVETGRYNAAGSEVPGVGEVVNVDDLFASLSPTYIKVMPRTDGWNHPFELFASQPWAATEPASAYAIISPGKDGRFSTSATTGGTTNFDCDIIYSNGSFLQYPEGQVTTTQ
jgi:type II secretion system protein G